MSAPTTDHDDDKLEQYILRAFQQEVIDKFIVQNDVRNTLIGDDMGLGKTYEAIALDWERRKKDMEVRNGIQQNFAWRPTLVVTLMSVVPHWEDEYAKALPHLRVVSMDPKRRATFVKAVQERSADIYIMHWDALRLIEDELRPVKWFHVIADEVHKIKNRKARMTVALKRQQTFYKTAMSGTPADNKPHDLWSILNWLYPNEYRSYWKFYKYYVKYEMSPEGYYKVTGVHEERLPDLHRELAPFFIRRRKWDVLKELPPKEYSTLWVDLTPPQRRAYNEMKKDMLTWIGEQDQSQPLAAPAAITRLVRLQQFALASIRTEARTRRKLNKDWEPYRKAWDNKYPHKAGQYPENDWRFQQWRLENYTAYLLEDPSSKIDAAMQLIEQTEDDDPLVFFSQFRTMTNLFARHLRDAGIPHAVLVGGVSKDERGRMIRDFQAGKTKVLCGTIAAGGIGITLTRANKVIFFDRGWVPAFNLQAEDRLHRIGQINPVQVIDLMARNTLDFGRVQGINTKWTNIQKMLGDKVFDYQRQQLRDQSNLSILEQIAQQIG
jgi:SNF2 family DNA or RNA helicase